VADGIAEMRRLTEEAIRAGAFGFTTSRTNAHKTTSARWCLAVAPRSTN
jgi:N-acyl-D-aspartate/D-glutamate deacylase